MLGAVLMIAGGRRRDVVVTRCRALSVKPLQLLGLISYSVYLVHWPLIVIPQQAASPSAPLPPWALLALGAASVPLGALLYRFVETPFRNPPALVGARPRRSLLLAGAASVVIVVFSATAAQASSAQRLDSGTAAPVSAPRAHPVGTAFVASNIRPALRLTSDDNPAIYDDGCHRDIPSTDASACTFGSDPDAPRVVLFGDSHGAQWFPALLPLAEAGTILLETDTKSDCPSVLVDPETVEPYPQCERWRSDVIERLNADPPALIVLASYAAHYRAPAASVESYGRAVARRAREDRGSTAGRARRLDHRHPAPGGDAVDLPLRPPRRRRRLRRRSATMPSTRPCRNRSARSTASAGST